MNKSQQIYSFRISCLTILEYLRANSGKQLLFVMSLLLSSCMSTEDRLHHRLSKEDRSNLHYKGHYKVGKPYKVKDQLYTPTNDTNYNRVGVASWYGNRHFHNRNTANGDQYSRHLLTAAHPTLPLPSLVKVTNIKNNKSIILMVNDRGPFVKNRILDVSERAAQVLGFKNSGITEVRVQYLPQETQDFLRKIALLNKEGAKVAKLDKRSRCSINCQIKLVNLKYNLAVNP